MIYFKIFLTWLVLLFFAILNAVLREGLYKPFLSFYIGTFWAHQISSPILTLIFFPIIYFFIKHNINGLSVKLSVLTGLIWCFLTLFFELFMNFYIRHLSLLEVLKTYYIWNGELWVLVLVYLLIAPYTFYFFINSK